jgi:hypothetical protein
VHADDRQLFGESLLELPQLREDVDAVDSPIGPEVEDRHLAAEVGERERSAAGPDPVETFGKLGGAYAWEIHGGMGLE